MAEQNTFGNGGSVKIFDSSKKGNCNSYDHLTGNIKTIEGS